MAAVAGWNTTIKVGGTPTAVTGEACTNTTGNTYQINTAAKRVWDYSVAVVAYDGGVPATVSSVDYLFGKVTLAAPPGGAVTVDVTYIPLLSVVQGKSVSQSTEIDELDASVFGSMDKVFIAGLRSHSFKLGTLDTLLTDLDSGAGTWTWSAKAAGTVILIEVDWEGTGANLTRGWSFIKSTSIESAVDSLVKGDIELQVTPVRAADGSLVSLSSGT